MSAEIAGVIKGAKARDVLTTPGQIGVVTSGCNKGAILLRIFSGYVSLNNPSSTWNSDCSLTVEVQPAGTVVTYTSEV